MYFYLSAIESTHNHAAFLLALKDSSLFRPIRLWPPLAKLATVAEEYERIIVVEANCGQYASVVEQQLKREVQRVSVLGGQLDLEQLGRRLR